MRRCVRQIPSGGDLRAITPPQLAVLRKLQPPTATAARFVDVKMDVGEADLDPRRRTYWLPNWDDRPRELSVSLSRRSRVREIMVQ